MEASQATDVGLSVPSARECTVPPVSGFTPVSAAAAVTKVKTLLVGLAPTDAEVAEVAADPAALSALVGRWMALPEYDAKMLDFFASSFQQDRTTYARLTFQFGPYRPFTGNTSEILQNFHQSFARTAMQLIAEGQPFTSTMTTTRFMMTPALMAAYAMLDSIHIDDRYNIRDLFSREHPTRVILQSARAIPLESSIDPASPDFMVFHHPGIAAQYAPGCPFGTIEYPAGASIMTVASFLLGHEPMPVGATACRPPWLPSAARYVRRSDFTTWRMITVRQPGAGEATTPLYDLPSMRAGRDLVLRIPRVGFFTTPAFFGRWETNDSNLARVLINQTTIVGLGRAIDLTNTTEPASLAALSPAHSPPGSTCRECHRSLDPMGQFFRSTYTLYGSVQDDRRMTALPGQFAFQGVSATGTTVSDLGAQLAAHPLFASAWVQRLCTYATSARCEESDPEFARLVGVFRDSNFSWNALVQALFASPLVTFLRETRTATSAGQTFPIARREHLCATLSARLGVADLCGLDVSTDRPSSVARTVAGSWPSGQYSRGNATAALAINPSLMMRGGMETLCVDLAQRLVDAGDASPFRSADPATAVRNLTRQLMGLTAGRAAGPEAILRSHFDSARHEGAAPDDALRSTFVVACLSPYVAGVGQ
jgi:hypothetical protein